MIQQDNPAVIRPDGFEEVFASYVEALPSIRGRADGLVRAPQAFSRVWAALACIPDVDRTILVTGSKGKGTVARLIAWNLQKSGDQVGLVVTPEELCHLDRIRIGNIPITKADFDCHLAACLPLLRAELEVSGPGRYLSPTGIFLTVALSWFRERSVDWYVIEGGRGVRADEIGQLKARLGVVTTVFDEHVTALGGSREMVIEDKLSISAISRTTVVGPQVGSRAGSAAGRACGLVVAQQVPALPSDMPPGYPGWFAELCPIARQALRLLQPAAEFTAFRTPSFWWTEVEGKRVMCEPIVNRESVDVEFIEWNLPQGTEVILGLSDDKDIDGIIERLRQGGIRRFSALALKSAAGHVNSKWLDRRSGAVERVGELDVVQPDSAFLRDVITRVAGRSAAVYIAGVQVFVRCVRQAMGVQLVGGQP